MTIILLKRFALLGVVSFLTSGLAIAQQCTSFGPGPGDIPDNAGGVPGLLELDVPTTGNDSITDVDVWLNIEHTWQGDLIIELTDPTAAVTVTLLSRPGDSDGTALGFSADNLGSPAGTYFILDDEAAQPYDSNTGWGIIVDPGIPDVDGPWIPYGLFPGGVLGGLTAFDGLNPNGTWTVTVTDNFGGDTGTVNEICLLIDSVLPVEMTSFTSHVNGTNVVLNWETASETNNAGFSIEQEDAPDVFTEIGYVEGHGTTVEPRDYRFTIEDLVPGLQRFRLKQIDFDGAFEYSEVVEATVTVPDHFLIEPAYPNPFNPTTTLRFAVAVEQHVAVTLVNTMGQSIRTLFSGTVVADEMQQVVVDAATLPSGSYLVHFEGRGLSATERIVLMK